MYKNNRRRENVYVYRELSSVIISRLHIVITSTLNANIVGLTDKQQYKHYNVLIYIYILHIQFYEIQFLRKSEKMSIIIFYNNNIPLITLSIVLYAKTL